MLEQDACLLVYTNGSSILEMIVMMFTDDHVSNGLTLTYSKRLTALASSPAPSAQQPVFIDTRRFR
jgi:hypothetical protein